MLKQNWLRPVRIILAIFIFGGFLLLFSDIKAKLSTWLYTSYTATQFLPAIMKLLSVHTLVSISFLFIILLTLFSGRVYCSVFCPLGIMQDAIAFLLRILPFKKKRRRFKKALDYLRYPILGLFLVSMIFLGFLSINWLDPYANFGRIAANIYQPVYILLHNFLANILNAIGLQGLQPLAMKLFTPVTFVTSISMFLLILVLVIYRDRLYCNTICPVGTILGLLSRVSFLKIRINKGSCTICGNCQTVCKANCINLKEQTVDMSRCVACFNCITSCEESAIGYIRKSIPVKKGENYDKSKRDFIRAGMLFLGAAPILANAANGNENIEHQGKRFCTRGPISPPGSRSIEEFKEYCIACQLCISACPSKVLQPAFLEYGFTGMMFPRMDNNSGFCNFECTKCGEVCPTGAIQKLTKKEKETVQIGTVQFRQKLCIVESEGTACGSCSEHCPTQAVYMVPYKGDLTIPEVNPEICVGCGACEYACPVEDPHVAIFVYPHEVHKVAKKPVIKELEVEEMEDFPF
jgi:ferredoxin